MGKEFSEQECYRVHVHFSNDSSDAAGQFDTKEGARIQIDYYGGCSGEGSKPRFIRGMTYSSSAGEAP